jgi:hypothetical protein
MSYEVLGALSPAPTGECRSSCKAGCSTSREIPEGLSAGRVQFLATEAPACLLPPNMGYNEDIRQLCNQSRLPVECYTAKATGTNFLGRGDALDAQRWQNWVPGVGASVKIPGRDDAPAGGSGTAVASAEPMSDTLFYGGIAAGVLVLGIGVYMMVKKS